MLSLVCSCHCSSPANHMDQTYLSRRQHAPARLNDILHWKTVCDRRCKKQRPNEEKKTHRTPSLLSRTPNEGTCNWYQACPHERQASWHLYKAANNCAIHHLDKATWSVHTHTLPTADHTRRIAPQQRGSVIIPITRAFSAALSSNSDNTHTCARIVHVPEAHRLTYDGVRPEHLVEREQADAEKTDQSSLHRNLKIVNL